MSLVEQADFFLAHLGEDASHDRVHGLVQDALLALDELYGNRPDFAEWVGRLADIVTRARDARPTSLKMLDAARSGAEADWLQRPHMLGYSAYVDRFAGDLRGVSEKIPYLKDMGVTYLHLLPLLKARPGDSDGGFAVTDYGAVEPRLGNRDDLRALAGGLRAAGISLCLDMVFNHTAREHEWAQKAIAGDKDYQAFYHFFPDRVLPDQYERHLDQVFPTTAPGNFTFVPELNQWVWTTFYPYQWDLNYANPAVFARMLDAVLALANDGVEVFRVDSAAYMWKELGTDCRGRPQTHRLLQAFRALIGLAAPAVALKAEAIVEARRIAKFLGSGAFAGRECHLAYHNALMSGLWAALAQGRADRLGAMLGDIPALPHGTAWVTYVRCHDDIGWGALLDPERAWGASAAELAQLTQFYAGGTQSSFARGASFQVGGGGGFHGTNGTMAALVGLEAAQEQGDAAALDAAIDRACLLHAAVLGYGGIPVLYMGDEIALANDRDYLKRGVGTDGRWLHRPFMDWDRVAALKQPGDAPFARFNARLRAMIAARQGLGMLHAAQSNDILAGGAPEILAFLRGGGQDGLLFLGNFADQPVHWRAPAAPWPNMPASVRDAIGGGIMAWHDGGIVLRPYQAMWLVPAD